MQKSQETNYRLMSAAVKPVFDLFTDNSISHPQRVPESGPGIIVANHRCDIDAFYIMANIRRPVNWIGASYLWNIPLLPVLLDAVGGIPISRFQSEARAAVDRAVQCLDQGQLVGIFPEGWNYIAENRFDWSVGEFQTGFARIAFRTRAPIIPMAMLGLHEQRAPQGWHPRIRKIIGVPVELQYIKGRVVYKKLHINVGKPVPVPHDADPADHAAVKQFTGHINDIVRSLYDDIPSEFASDPNFTPITAVPGMGKPLPADLFAEDILDAIKTLRRAAREIRKNPDQPTDFDDFPVTCALRHRPALLTLQKSPDRNEQEMSNQYLNWLDQIESAQNNGARIKDFFQPYLRRHST